MPIHSSNTTQSATSGIDLLLKSGSKIPDLTRKLDVVRGHVVSFISQANEFRASINLSEFSKTASFINSISESLAVAHSATHEFAQIVAASKVAFDGEGLLAVSNGIKTFVENLASIEKVSESNMGKIINSFNTLRSLVIDTSIYEKITEMFKNLWRSLSESNIPAITEQLTALAVVLERLQKAEATVVTIAEGLNKSKSASGGGGSGSGGGGPPGDDGEKVPGELTQLSLGNLKKIIDSTITSWENYIATTKRVISIEKSVVMPVEKIESQSEASDFSATVQRNLGASVRLRSELQGLAKQYQQVVDKTNTARQEIGQLSELYGIHADVVDRARMDEMATEAGNTNQRLQEQIVILNNNIEGMKNYIQIMGQSGKAIDQSKLSLTGLLTGLKDMRSILAQRKDLLSDLFPDDNKMRLFKTNTEEAMDVVKNRLGFAETAARNLERQLLAVAQAARAAGGEDTGEGRTYGQQQATIQNNLEAVRQGIHLMKDQIAQRKGELDGIKLINSEQTKLNKLVLQYGSDIKKIQGYLSTPDLIKRVDTTELKSIEATIERLKKLKVTLDSMQLESTLPKGDLEKLPEYILLLMEWDDVRQNLNRTLETMKESDGLEKNIEAQRQLSAAAGKTTDSYRGITSIIIHSNKVVAEHAAAVDIVINRMNELTSSTGTSNAKLQDNRHMLKALTDQVRATAKYQSGLVWAIEKQIAQLEIQLDALNKTEQGETNAAEGVRRLITELEASKSQLKINIEELGNLGSKASAAGADIHSLDTMLRNLTVGLSMASGIKNVQGFDLTNTEGLQRASAYMRASTTSEKERLLLVKEVNKHLSMRETELNKAQKAEQRVLLGDTIKGQIQQDALILIRANIAAERQLIETLRVTKSELESINAEQTARETSTRNLLSIQQMARAPSTDGSSSGLVPVDTVALEERRAKLFELAQAQLIALDAAKKHAAEVARGIQPATKDIALNKAQVAAVSDASRELSKKLQAVSQLKQQLLSLNPTTDASQKEINELVIEINTLSDGVQNSIGVLKTQENALKDFGHSTEDAATRVGNTIKMQIRHFSSFTLIYGTISLVRKTFSALIEESHALGRAAAVSRSSIDNLEGRIRVLNDTMDKARVIFGRNTDEIGTAMYQLGSAGLTLEQSVAAIGPTMDLVVGTGAEVNEISKMLAATFNILSQQAALTGNALADFSRISDVIAVTFRDNQIEMDEFVQALKFTVPIAHQVGVSFEQLAATLGTLHTQGMKAGLAGRQLRTIFFKLASNRKEFEKAFKEVGIEIDPRGPLNFIKIMQDVGAALKGNRLTAQQLEDVLNVMGIRSAGTFLALADSIGLLNQNMELTEKYSFGVARALRNIKMDQLGERLNILTENLYSFIKTLIGPFMLVLKYIVGGLNSLADGIRFLNNIIVLGDAGILEWVARVIGAILSLSATIAILKASITTIIGAFAFFSGELVKNAARLILSSGAVAAANLTEKVSTDGVTLSIGAQIAAKMKLIKANGLLSGSQVAGVTAGSAFTASLAAMKQQFITIIAIIGTLITSLKFWIVILSVAIPIAIAWGVWMTTAEYKARRLSKSVDKLADTINRESEAIKENQKIGGAYERTIKDIQRYQKVLESATLSAGARASAQVKLNNAINDAINLGYTQGITSEGDVLRANTDIMEEHLSVILAINKAKLAGIRAEKEAEAKDVYESAIEYASEYIKELNTIKGIEGRLAQARAIVDRAEAQGRVTGGPRGAQDAWHRERQRLGMSGMYQGLIGANERLNKSVLELKKTWAILMGSDEVSSKFRKHIEAVSPELAKLIFSIKTAVAEARSLAHIDIRLKMVDDAKEFGVVFSDNIKSIGEDMKTLDRIFKASSEDFTKFISELQATPSPQISEALTEILLSSMEHLVEDSGRVGEESGDEYVKAFSESVARELSEIQLSRLVINGEGNLDAYTGMIRFNQLAKEYLGLTRNIKGVTTSLVVESGKESKHKDITVENAKLALNMKIQELGYAKLLTEAEREASVVIWGVESTLERKIQLTKDEITSLQDIHKLTDLQVAKIQEMVKSQEGLSLEKFNEDMGMTVDLTQEASDEFKKLAELYKRVISLRKNDAENMMELKKAQVKYTDDVVRAKREREQALGIGENEIDQLTYIISSYKERIASERRLAWLADKKGADTRQYRLAIRKLDTETAIAQVKLNKLIKEQGLLLDRNRGKLLASIEGEKSIVGLGADMVFNYRELVGLNEDRVELMQRHARETRKTRKDDEAIKQITASLLDNDMKRVENIAEHLNILRAMSNKMKEINDLLLDFLDIQRSAIVGMRDLVNIDLDNLVDNFSTILNSMGDRNIATFTYRMVSLFRSLDVVSLSTSEQIERMVDHLKRGKITAADVERKFGSAFGNMAHSIVEFEKRIDDLNAKEMGLVKQMAGFDISILSMILGKDKLDSSDIAQARDALGSLSSHVRSIADTDPDSAIRLFETVRLLAERFGQLTTDISEDEVFIKLGIDPDNFYKVIGEITKEMEKFIGSMDGKTFTLNFKAEGKDGFSVDLAKAFIAEVGKLLPTLRIPGMASGGFVSGSGTGDTVPAMLTPGEFVLPKKIVDEIGVDKLYELIRSHRGNVKQLRRGNIGFFEYLNELENIQGALGFNSGGLVPGVRGFSGGGFVGGAASGISPGQLSLSLNDTDVVKAAEKFSLEAFAGLVRKFKAESAMFTIPLNLTPTSELLKQAESLFESADSSRKKQVEGDLKDIIEKFNKGKLRDSLIAMRKLFNTVMSEMLDDSKSLFARFGISVAQGFIDAFSRGVAGFADAVSDILNAILTMAWIPYNDELEKKTRNTMKNIANSYESGLAALVKQLRRNEISYFDYLNNLEDLNDKYRDDMANALKDDEKEEAKYAVERVRAITDAMHSGAMGVVGNFTNTFVSAIVDSLGNAAKNSVSDLFTTLGSVVVSSADWISNIFSKMGSDIDKNSGDVDIDKNSGGFLDKIKKYGSVTADVLSDMAGAAVSAGAIVFAFGASIASLDLGKVKNFFLGSEEFDLPSIVDTIDAVVAKIVEELPEIVKVIAAELPKMLTSFIEGLDKVIPVIIEAVEAFLDTLIENADQIIEVFKTLISGIIESAIKSLPKLGQLIADLVGGIIDIVVEEVLPNLGKIVEGLLDAIINIVFSIVDRLGDIIGGIVAAIPGIITAILKAIPKLITRILEAIPKIVEGLVNAIPEVIDALSEQLPELIENLIDELPKLIGALISMIPKIVIAIIKAIPAILKSLGKSIEGILGPIFKHLFQNIFDGLSGLFKKILDGIVGIFTKIKNWFGDRAKGAWNTVTGWVTGDKKHSGGIVGYDTNTQQYGLKPDEVLTILQTGEGVLNRDVMSALGKERFTMLNSGIPLEHMSRSAMGSTSVSSPLINTANSDNSINLQHKQEIKVEFHNCTFAGSGEPLVDEIENALARKYHNRDGSLQRIIRGNMDNKNTRPNVH
jgi:TP901 family phage tail tape measure protein